MRNNLLPLKILRVCFLKKQMNQEENLNIKAIPTSTIVANLCDELGIETTTLEDAKPDFDFINKLPGKKILLKGNNSIPFILLSLKIIIFSKN